MVGWFDLLLGKKLLKLRSYFGEKASEKEKYINRHKTLVTASRVQ